MLRIGDKITIKKSNQLTQSGNGFLVNKKAVITQLALHGGSVGGVYADVKIMRKTRNFYIPLKSVESLEDVNKVRVQCILKSTVL